MSQDDKLIDLNAERAKRVHDLNDKRLNEVRQAFEQAMPRVMFFDNVVIAGVLTVSLMLVFFAGFGFFIWKDSHKRKKP
eukprot:gene5628-5506_t